MLPKPLFLLAALLSPLPASAWGPAGHRAVALLAASRLEPATRRKLKELLGPGVTLERIAVCADAIREGDATCAPGFSVPGDSGTGDWHFIDIPVSDAPSAESLGRYCRRHGRADACVVEQIRAELAVLRAPAASRERKRLAVMYLVHFVGDVHQPLHCAAELDSAGRSDRGGNLKSVYVGGFSEPTNLHALWDGLLYAGRGRPPSARALAKDLEKDLAGKDVAAWTRGDVVSQAALESFALARDKVYPAYRKDGGRVSLAEEESLRPIVDERLERAGVRLAFLLDQSFR